MEAQLENKLEFEKVIDINDITHPKLEKFKNRRSSFFRLESPLGTKFKSESYVENLKTEIQDWGKTLNEIKILKKAYKNAPPTLLDETVFTPDEKQYLAQAIDLQEFIDKSEKFRKETLFYVKQKEWIQRRIQFAQNQLEDEIYDQIREKILSRDETRQCE